MLWKLFFPKDLVDFPIGWNLTNAREGLIWVATPEDLYSCDL